MALTGDVKIFVSHRATWVHLIPAGWLEAWRPNRFREATAREIAAWYDERDIEAPTEITAAILAEGSEGYAEPAASMRDEPARGFTVPA